MGLLMVVALCHRLGPSSDSQKWIGYFLLRIRPTRHPAVRARPESPRYRLAAAILLFLVARTDWGSSDGTLVLPDPLMFKKDGHLC